MDGFLLDPEAERKRKQAIAKRRYRAENPQKEIKARIGTARNLLLRNGWKLIDKHGTVYTLKKR